MEKNVLDDFEMDEAVTCEVAAEAIGARCSIVTRLAQHGLIETIEPATGEPMVPRRAIIQLRRMYRLRHDLGVNFVGASIILDLVGRIEALNRELAELREKSRD